jgi:AraC-like DNA-binding protein
LPGSLRLVYTTFARRLVITTYTGYIREVFLRQKELLSQRQSHRLKDSGVERVVRRARIEPVCRREFGRKAKMTDVEAVLHIITVDCCNHMLAALGNLPFSRFTPMSSSETGNDIRANNHEVDLIVIGVASFPVRRLFISQLRRVYPHTPVLILRREEVYLSAGNKREYIRGEFLISDKHRARDYKIIEQLRAILPLQSCQHTHKGRNYDIVREVVRVIVEKYPDPDLNLGMVARQITMSPARLSRILNKQVGVSFRQLLRQTRIEEAKRMLALRHYSVKEVAAKVGFSDSHYFSRSFKELTGLNASEYRPQDAFFN